MDWRNLIVSTKEDCLGGLTTGKWADLAFFGRDLSRIPADEWLEAKVEMTILDGEIVYGKEA